MANLFKLEDRVGSTASGLLNSKFLGIKGNYLERLNATDRLQVEAPTFVHFPCIRRNCKRNAFFFHKAGSFKDLRKCYSTFIT